MNTPKPILVRHPNHWRYYCGDRKLLEVLSLGDVIPCFLADWCEDDASLHLHSRVGAPADIISVHVPTESDWSAAAEIIGSASSEGPRPEALRRSVAR